jgi:Uncharacterised nucleotidyltransferase
MGDLIQSSGHKALNRIGGVSVPDCPPELSLLLAVANVDLIPDQQDRVCELLVGALDWQYLLDLANWHSLEPLLFFHLDRCAGQSAPEVVPLEIMQSLREKCREIARRNLILTAKLQEVSTHLRSREIEHISYKGPLMAETFYGDLTLRESHDLDILVPPSKFAAAQEALAEIGFGDMHNFSAVQRAASLRWGFEYSFIAAGGLEVELHWRVVPRFISRSLDMAGIWRRLTLVRLFDCDVPSFCPEDSLVALCLHAGKHGWAHLSHFCDMAQLLVTHPQMDWDIVCSHLGDSNTARNVYVSLHLLEQHWSVEIPEGVKARTSADPQVTRVASRVQTEAWPSPRPALTQSNLHWLLERSSGEALGDRLRFLMGVAFSPTWGDFAKVDLPQILTPLYRGVRIWRVACEYGSSWLQG